MNFLIMNLHDRPVLRCDGEVCGSARPTSTEPLVLAAPLASNAPMDTTSLPRLGDPTRDQYQHHLSCDYVRWLACLTDTTLPSNASKDFLLRYPHSVGATIVRKSVENLERKAPIGT